MASPESEQKGQDSDECEIVFERRTRERKAIDRYKPSYNHGNDLEDIKYQPKPNDDERGTKTASESKSVGTRGAKRNENKRGEYMLGPNAKPEDVKHRSMKRKLKHDALWEKVWKTEDQVKGLQEKVKELQERYRNKNHEICKLKKENQDKAKQVKDKTDAKIKQLEEKVNSTELESKDLKSKVQELNETILQQKIDIQAMCNERVELLNKGDISAQPDDIVAREIRKFFSRSRELATKFAINDWSDTTKEGKYKVANSLRQGSVSEFASDRLLTALHKGSVPPKVIVNAFFNRALCHETFLQPLGILNFGDPQISSQKLMDRLSRVSHLLSKQSLALNFRFRTLCLNSLKNIKDSTSEKESGSEDELHVQKLRSGCAQRIVDQILDDCESTLLDFPNEATRQTYIKDLEIMATEFVNLHVDLSSQYPQMEMRFRDSLLDHGFTTFHEQFRGHRALKLKDDKDDDVGETAEEAGIEGQKLDLVIEPCVARSGNAGGTLYDQERILVKGVVWMVRPDKIKAEPGLRDTLDAGKKTVPIMHLVGPPTPTAVAKNGKSARQTHQREVLDSVEVPQKSTMTTSYLPLLPLKPPIQHQAHVAETRSSATTTPVSYASLGLPSPARQGQLPLEKAPQTESTYAKRPLSHHELDDKPFKKQKKWHSSQETVTAAQSNIINLQALPQGYATDESYKE